MNDGRIGANGRRRCCNRRTDSGLPSRSPPTSTVSLRPGWA